MKNVVIAIMLVFCISIVTANAQDIYGGETITYTIDRCNWLTVNITPSDLHEWRASPSCIEEIAGNFRCVCDNNYALSLSPAPNSVGDFNIVITNYWLSGEVSTCPACIGGVTREIIYKNMTNNITKLVDVYVERIVYVNHTVYVNRTINQTVEVPVVVEKVLYPAWILIIFFIAVSVVGFVIGKKFALKREVKKKSNIEDKK